MSASSAIVEGDTNDAADVFLYRVSTDTTEVVSVAPDGTTFGNGPSALDGSALKISGDGNTVIFSSEADNLVPDDTNGVADVFIRDLVTGQTSLLSANATGGSASGPTSGADVAANGSMFAFKTTASDIPEPFLSSCPDAKYCAFLYDQCH